jgi:hypothetical protein
MPVWRFGTYNIYESLSYLLLRQGTKFCAFIGVWSIWYLFLKLGGRDIMKQQEQEEDDSEEGFMEKYAQYGNK